MQSFSIISDGVGTSWPLANHPKLWCCSIE